MILVGVLLLTSTVPLSALLARIALDRFLRAMGQWGKTVPYNR